jgi:hypothetical protein
MSFRDQFKEYQLQWLAWMIIVLATLAISLFFGVNYPVPEQPDQPPEPVELGTTHFAALDVEGAVNYGSNDLYPLGHSTSGLQAVYGTDTITGTATASHGLTTVSWAQCTLGQDPSATAGDPAHCTVLASSNVITVSVWQDDFVTAATAGGTVHWLVIGTP